MVWASLENLRAERIALREGLRSLTPPQSKHGLGGGEQGECSPLLSLVIQRHTREPCLVRPNSLAERARVVPAPLGLTPQIPPLILTVVTPKLKILTITLPTYDGTGHVYDFLEKFHNFGVTDG